MATPTRVLSALTLLLLAGGAAVAQPPIAPPPHPTLDDLVTEYLRLGLPVLPPTAELVRIDWFKFHTEGGRENWMTGNLALRLPPVQPGGVPRYWKGLITERDDVDPYWVSAVSPTSDALHRVYFVFEPDPLLLAIQCRIRKWDELAIALHARAREEIALRAAIREEVEPSSVDVLRDVAWVYWRDLLTERGTDRQEILRHLKGLAREAKNSPPPDGRDRRDRSDLIHRLELTVAPRKSKPDSVESLIDDLTEYWIDRDPFSGRLKPRSQTGLESYWKLVELGFDAVPTLIEHLKDERLTRGTALFGGGKHFDLDLRVEHLAGQILDRLSNGLIKDGPGFSAIRQEQVILDPAQARAWWDEVQKIGEEKWLLRHAIPERKSDGKQDTAAPNEHIIRVIGVKYPAKLPELYRTILRAKPEIESEGYVDGIIASKLTREQKIALLEEGVTHEGRHREYALNGLAELDPPRFRKHVLATLRQIHIRVENGNRDHNWGILELAERANDLECWNVLFAIYGKMSVESRIDTIWHLGSISPLVTDDPIRRQRLRFLLEALDDRSIDPKEVKDEWTELRDFAAQQLAGLLRFPVNRLYIGSVWYDKQLGGLSRFVLREFVRQVATRELAVGK